jgi:hypothetical protein
MDENQTSENGVLVKAAQRKGNLKTTIFDLTWYTKNEDVIRDMFPEEWTHVSDLNLLKIGYLLKLRGVDWTSKEELAEVLAFLTTIKLIYAYEEIWFKANKNSCVDNYRNLIASFSNKQGN